MKQYTILIGLMFVFLGAYANKKEECKMMIEPSMSIVVYPLKYKFEESQLFNVISYNKKTGYGVAYNDNCIIDFMPYGYQIKSIKKSGIKDIKEKETEKYDIQIESIKRSIYNNVYSKFQADSIVKREQFIKDSLAHRNKFVEDSIKCYQAYVKDSLKEWDEHVRLMLTVDSMRTEFEGQKTVKAKIDKQFWGSKGSPVAINMVYWDSNSVGGITAKFEVFNLSKKTIKYVAITGYFKNAVGDRVYNQIGSGSTYTVRGIGPIGPAPTSVDEIDLFSDAVGTYEFDDCFFYSKTANTIEVSSVKLTYTDGSTQTVSGKILEKHLYWKEDDIIDAVYHYKDYIEYLKNYNQIEAMLSNGFPYNPKEYEPINYSPIYYKPAIFNFNNNY